MTTVIGITENIKEKKYKNALNHLVFPGKRDKWSRSNILDGCSSYLLFACILDINRTITNVFIKLKCYKSPCLIPLNYYKLINGITK